MPEITIESVAGKLNRVGYDAFIQGLRHAKQAGNRNLELAHLLLVLLAKDDTDIALTAGHYKLDRAKLAASVATAVEALRKNETELPGISNHVADVLDRGWHYATLFFGETQIRTGHLLLGALKSHDLKRVLTTISPEFGKIPIDDLAAEHRNVWKNSAEENLRPVDGSGVVAAGAAPQGGAAGTTALDRFSQDLTALAASGTMDPVVGREEEIRQIIDVLMRRRQNNPILTGEAGVGKTAVVEGFAQRVAAGTVPDALKGVKVRALDIALMQAGASMKGEFEQRLRSVIDEVQGSPTPIVLFIDEAHTLIGAGGAAGTGDAANILKPALARGKLRTIAATTWAEYRRYFEGDPALTRRFQPVPIEEPDFEKSCAMLRGAVTAMEKHHRVAISDSAIVAAVRLSQRYLPARQLPDKAISLLDTACARVAVSQNAEPAILEDVRVRIAALNQEKDALSNDRNLGVEPGDRLTEIEADIGRLQSEVGRLETEWKSEQRIVGEIKALREKLPPRKDGSAAAATPPESGAAPAAQGGKEGRDQIAARYAELAARDAALRMIYPHVDEQAVASVLSDWTGIPVGRMVRDEINTVLRLGQILGERVLGQGHGLQMIAKRIETNRAKLDNPGKPVGVFMLCGPSGVGKTETALALAEALYGGEQSIITINMSEFQEAHTVSTLKGAPPGYVGYGEGGRLTEAVRRKPYSVVLLDEVEKAHPDVHEVFFQVFDKGVMEDGTGRRIDFRNTLIILTTNVGTDVIMSLAQDPAYRTDPRLLEQRLRPELLKVFPPALLGRIVSVPYFPLSAEMLTGIVRLQLGRVGKRIKENHGAAFSYSDRVVDHIVALCDNPDAGGRMVDNIITNSILPSLSRAILNASLGGQTLSAVSVDVADGDFTYAWETAAAKPAPAAGTQAKVEAFRA